MTDELLDGDGDALTETTPLLEWGVLDSLSMLALLAFIEEHIGTRVPDERVRPEHFQNLGRLTALLSELATTAPPEPPPPDLAATGATPARVVSRVANAGHQVVLRDVAVPSGGTRPVMHAPGPDPAWLLIPGPLEPSSSWGAMLRTQVDHAATWAPSLLGLGPDEPGTEAGLSDDPDAYL